MALLELIYTSLAEAKNDTNDVKAILASSERNNVATNITGLLLFDGERYIQILEGDVEDVNGLFVTISEDSRHHSLELLHKGEIAGRSFETWRMAYEAIPKGLLSKLAENMGVVSLELEGEAAEPSESFGARLNTMFKEAVG